MTDAKTGILPGVRFEPQGTRLAEGLTFWRDAANTGILQRRGRALVIGGASADALRQAGVERQDIDWVLLTHHHRTACGDAHALAACGVRIAAPRAERELFERPGEFWADDSFRVHAYRYHPSPQTLREPTPVARGLSDGDTLEWRGLLVRAVGTPGVTAGSLSYVVTIDGKTIAFIGDLMCAPGRFWEMHSLQGAFPLPDGGETMEYHGFGERAWAALESLERLLAMGVDVLAPTRGQVMRDPAGAVRKLRRNVNAFMDNYASISAARWHFAGSRPAWPAADPAMLARVRPAPSWVQEIGGTTRALVADSGRAFLIDCDGEVPERVRGLQESGRMGAVECLWVTHYHDDHVGRIAGLRAAQRCSVIAHESMADVLRRPDAYRMPCLFPDPVPVDRVTRDGETWEWRGFRLTAYSFPGQTLLDAALLVERGAESVLFVGDSLSPGGIDDYCAHNRNLLGPGLGHDRSLAILQKLSRGPWGASGGLLVNQHIPGAFAFSAEELQEMRERLAERRRLLLRLLPWDDPNYGIDPQWARCDPYRQIAEPGACVEWRLLVRNHSRVRRRVEVELALPADWEPLARAGAGTVQPGAECALSLSARVPRSGSGRAVVGFSIRYAGAALGEIAEGIVDIAPLETPNPPAGSRG
jgi:glyoxylase-like metal-dependent hydrolase (beta-lactamase superfamily II)